MPEDNKNVDKAVEGLDLVGLSNGELNPDLPPVEQWNPEFTGDIDMRIGRDGTWYYLESPIARERLVKLFSGILRREGDQYFLVTPVEKVGITVDDAPFIAVGFELLKAEKQQKLLFETSVGDRVIVDADHPLWVEYNQSLEPSPYVMVRAGLKALISRTVFYHLVDLGYEVREGSEKALYIDSCGIPFKLGSYN